MSWLQTIRMALKSVSNNKVRSILTMLGVIVGVASVIAIVSVIQGLNTLSRLQFEAMGSNQIQVNGFGPSASVWRDFEAQLDTGMDGRIRAWTPQIRYWDWQNKGVKYRTKSLSMDSTNVYFGNEQYGLCTNNVISVGRDLSKADCDNAAKVCVIGEAVRKSFFGAMSPLGQSIRIGGTSFQVVGVYKGKYGGMLNSLDQMILLPYTLSNRMMGNTGGDKEYYIRAERREDIEGLSKDMEAFLKASYDTSSGKGYISVYSNSQWQQQAEASNNQIALIGGGIAGISLLVGGIGIMNIMLVSVTERTREIGIRMAIGARKRDIISQFLIEAAVVSCCGGAIGIALGCIASAALGNMLIFGSTAADGWTPVVEQFTVLPSLPLILGAFLFSALLGIVFGLYPANKASNLQPVEALRTQ